MKTTEGPLYLLETACHEPIAVCRSYEQAVAAVGELSEERRKASYTDYAVRIRLIPELAPWVMSSNTDEAPDLASEVS